ncbi:MAG: hypothetical protein RLZ98_2498 [Pseudomonadota bacterium]
MSISVKNQGGQSIVDECLTMRGDLESEADILVKGKVIGNIVCNLLIVDKGALVEGGVDAKEIIVRGSVKGVVKAETVRLEKTADAACDIYHKVFAAEEGARISGSLKALDDAPKKSGKDVRVATKLAAPLTNGAAPAA